MPWEELLRLRLPNANGVKVGFIPYRSRDIYESMYIYFRGLLKVEAHHCIAIPIVDDSLLTTFYFESVF